MLTSPRVAYFFINDSPIQFKVCAIFQLSIDMSKWSSPSRPCVCPLTRQTVIVVQRILYGNAPPDSTLLPMEDDLEEALALSEER